MAALPFGLTIVSAFLHAFWNMWVRGSSERELVVQWGLVASLILFLPALFFTIPASWPGGAPFGLILSSAFFEVLYFAFLIGAYGSGQLSVVYPLARGTSPLVVSLVSAFVLGHPISLNGWIGVVLIVSGISILSIAKGEDKGNPGPGVMKSSALAVLAGLCIAGYTLTDSFAVARCHPLPFKYAVFIFMALGYSSLNLFRYRSVKVLRLPRNSVRPILIVGFCSFFTYLLVLYAMRLSPVSLVAALRETSILFAVLLGRLVLKEKLTTAHILGITILFMGMISLKLA